MRVGSLLMTTSMVLVAIALAACGNGGAATTADARLGASTAAGAGTSAPTSGSAESPSLSGTLATTSQATGTTKPSPRATSTKVPTKLAAATPTRPEVPRDIVWIRTPVLTHDKDFHDFTPYLNPAVPRNWVSPVDYRDGDITIRIEIVGAHQPAAVPIITWSGGPPGRARATSAAGRCSPRPREFWRTACR